MGRGELVCLFGPPDNVIASLKKAIISHCYLSSKKVNDFHPFVMLLI